MNKQRRKKLERISGELTRLYWELHELSEEELGAFENMPESFQNSDRGLAMEYWADMLVEWCNGIEEVYSAIDVLLEDGR